MTRLRRFLVAAAILAIAAGTLAVAAPADDALPSSPRRWVTDEAGFLSAAARAGLDAELESYERRTGHQVLVWIGRTSGGFTPEDFASKAFAAWRVGRANIDDGLVLFVFADDRKLRVEVGYGLETRVPDVEASRILRDVVVPRIQAGDRDGAITAGVAALTAKIDGTAASDGTTSAPTPSATDDGAHDRRGGRRLTTGEKVVIGLLVVGFLILLITNPSLALWLLFNLFSGGGGGRSSGGGGFSGGGGRSGGGGASGSW